jgi:ribosome-binding protein aMBF1 (putative translation factor)
MDAQDWNMIQIKGQGVKPQGASILSNAKVAPEVTQQRKLAEADAPTKVKKLAAESRQEMVNKRAANKWSQQDLNQQCNFPVNTIREMEAGRLTPTIQQLNTLNRVLKTGLKLA